MNCAAGADDVADLGRVAVEFAHVLLEVKVSTESLLADGARVGFPLVVRVHVKGQIVDLVEGLVADLALELFLLGMGQSVVLVVALLVESFAAVLADEWLEPLMDAQVGIQSGGAVEGLSARSTFVRLLGGVYDLVTTQGTGLSEALVADLTNEGPSTRVDGHVSREVVMGVELLAAFWTGEVLWRFGHGFIHGSL